MSTNNKRSVDNEEECKKEGEEDYIMRRKRNVNEDEQCKQGGRGT